MPVIDVHSASSLVSISSESLSLTTGANSLVLKQSPIMSSLGDRVGAKGDTSLSLSEALTTEVAFNVGLRSSNTLSAGQYAVDYETGLVIYNSGSTTTITASYKVRQVAGSAASSTANTPEILTTAGDVIAANGARKGWAIQNLDTDPLFVRLGTGASSSIFHFVLKGGTGTDDGTAGSISQTDGSVYQGIISVAGTTPRFTILEMT